MGAQTKTPPARRGPAKQRGLSFEIDREGGNHTLYSLGGVVTVTIGRHPTSSLKGAKAILKQCEPALGKGWWR